MNIYCQTLTLFIVFFLYSTAVSADKLDTYQIYSRTKPPKIVNIKYPLWFKSSFFDIPEDIADARQAGKRGVILFFSQENCNHCQAYIEATFKDPAIKNRLRKNFDVIGLEIFSDIEVTDIDGSILTIKELTEKHKAFLTPTLLFYGVDNTRLLRLMGFYPPEKFHQVLDYIEGGHYSNTRLSQYLNARHKERAISQNRLLENKALFREPPHNLTITKTKVKRPTLVLFERPGCNPCQRFHSRVLTDPKVRQMMSEFLAVRLDATDNSSKITTPNGRQLTPRQWAENLQLNYDVSVVFFDEQGKEVFRNDAETGSRRMAFTMEYVLTKGYLEEKQVNRWRRKQALKNTSRFN